MRPGARIQAAVEMLGEIEAAISAGGPPADQVAQGFLRARRYMGSKDRRAVSERVWGVLRRRARLGWWIRHRADPGHELPVDARRIVLADLVLSDGMDEDALAALCAGGHAPRTLGAAERRFLKKLTGRALNDPDMPEWVRLECPPWVLERLRGVMGEALDAELAALGREAPVDLRVNTLKTTREDALRLLQGGGVGEVALTPWSPWGLRLSDRAALGRHEAFRDGLLEVQDEGSQILALLVEARPGEAVADFCAGAGGKTLALAAAMQNKGRLVACDVSASRLERAAQRLRRAGAHNVGRRVLAAAGERWVKRAAGTFDRVLVDAPCTGVGAWRRNPDARWRLAESDLAELTAVQTRILDSAARLVKPGGRLVYATCSLLAEENEERVRAFLETHPAFRPLSLSDIRARVVGSGCPGFEDDGGSGGMLRLTPARHGTDGFFAALLQRAPET